MVYYNVVKPCLVGILIHIALFLIMNYIQNIYIFALDLCPCFISLLCAETDHHFAVNIKPALCSSINFIVNLTQTNKKYKPRVIYHYKTLSFGNTHANS